MIVTVIPAYNEAKRIGAVVRKAKKHSDRVLVIDDGSTDSTAAAARRAGAVVARHKRNLGVAAATLAGFNKALKSKADIIVTLDADGQHDPDDIPKLVRKIREGYDFVLGQRYLRKYPTIKRIGNVGLGALTNLLCRTRLNDTECGFRAYSRRCLAKILPNLTADRYKINCDILYEVGHNKFRSCNVPVEYPVYIKGKGFKVIDGFRNFFFLLRKVAKRK